MTRFDDDSRYPELRAGVRETCAAFGNDYFRKTTRERRYPEEFFVMKHHSL